VKILLVHNKYQQPGGEDVVFEQERNLLENAGHRIATYCRNNSEIDDSSLVKRLQLAKNTVASAQSRGEILQLLGKEKFDVVHVHNTFMVISPTIYSACQRAGVPVVQTLHNYRLLCPAANFYRQGHTCEECPEHGVWRGVKHACYRDSRAATATVALMLMVHRSRHTWTEAVDSYVALSKFARRKFIDGGFPADRICVKPNFVQPDPGQRSNGGGNYAVYVGRLSAEKGPATLLAAWKLLGNRVPLVIVGDGPMYADLEKQAREHGLTSISFRGRLPRAEAQAVMRGARVLILPSECYENFPMGMAESFACGVPVICSRLGALEELVDDGRTGLHFTAGSSEDLAAKVNWAWANPERMREMGNQARREYENRYTAEKNYPLVMDVYSRAIAHQREAHV